MSDVRSDVRSDRSRHATRWIRASIFVLVAALGASPATLRAQHPGEAPSFGDPGPCASLVDADRLRCEREETERRSGALRASRAYHARLADRLAADGGARNLALAANLRAMSLTGDLNLTETTRPRLAGDAKLAAWRDRAAREGRADPLVLGLLIRRLSPDDDARRRGVRESWRMLEPTNLLVLPDDDAAEALEILASVGEARRFDVHFGTLLRVVIDAVDRHPPNARESRWLFDDETPTSVAYGISLAFALLELPQFTTLIDVCKGDALSQPGRREACARYGALLADASDTLIAHMIGLAILRNAAPDAAGRECIEARRRRAAWVMQQWYVVAEKDPVGFADWQASVLRASPDIDEMTLMRRALEANGIPVEPPPDYRHVPMP